MRKDTKIKKELVQKYDNIELLNHFIYYIIDEAEISKEKIPIFSIKINYTLDTLQINETKVETNVITDGDQIYLDKICSEKEFDDLLKKLLQSKFIKLLKKEYKKTYN